ncbi:hypothetical protein [Sphingomonas sp.]|jgi:hypothetical protein|uniref:hypothetical protein n=1 Tax=Sphingomonas sp. TaxID=28214 RepID=UPI002DE48D32|nr:hypothetical protein [Sphingomonas sp.]
MLDERTRIAASGAPIDPAGVVGWGVDADAENDPTYPFRDRSQDQGLTKDWERPPQQQSDVEILQSIEHIRTPAVFGTSTPPHAVSGVIRRAAFRWSESNWLHWLLLMGADRINVVEGVVEDLGRGKIPNVPAEMGARAEWRHNKRGFFIKSAVVIGAAVGAAALIRSRRDDHHKQQPDHLLLQGLERSSADS